MNDGDVGRRWIVADGGGVAAYRAVVACAPAACQPYLHGPVSFEGYVRPRARCMRRLRAHGGGSLSGASRGQLHALSSSHVRCCSSPAGSRPSSSHVRCSSSPASSGAPSACRARAKSAKYAGLSLCCHNCPNVPTIVIVSAVTADCAARSSASATLAADWSSCWLAAIAAFTPAICARKITSSSSNRAGSPSGDCQTPST